MTESHPSPNASHPDREPAAPIVEVRGLTKRFPGVVANENVNLAIRPGEVHVLLGENGAGKSTLIGMISGVLQPDEGAILVDDRAQSIASPRRALALGIGTVFQHSMLVPSLTVVENLALGAPWWQNPGVEARAAALADLARELGLQVDPSALVGELSLGEQQQVEILRALMRGSRVLILDEATAMLTPQGAADLGALMRRLVKRGVAVIFITHKLNEAFEFGDRITVLRLGRKVGEIAPGRLAVMGPEELQSEVVQLMFGTTPVRSPAEARLDGGAGEVHTRRDFGAAILRIRDLHVPTASGRPVVAEALEVAPGEILGVAGIDGNGQKELAEAIAGQRPCTGSVVLEGEAMDALDVGERRRRGLRYVTDDRLSEGTVGAFPVAINLVLKEIGESPFWVRGIERPETIVRHARSLVSAYDVRTPSVKTPVGRLSGGNIQKVLLARELTGRAKVVIYSKPTYGLDLNNILALRTRIREAAASGVATILISTDLEEILELCDRIAVMSRGRLMGTVRNEESARRRVGELMVAA